MKAKSIWKEIRNDFMDNNIVHIDGWMTEDENENGNVIAKVNTINNSVEYLDERAKTDEYAQEIINETLSN